MDNTTAAAVQEALELLKAGRKAEAHAILAPIVKQSPDVAEAWYLFGFTVTDPSKRLYCFQQVLRIDPFNQAAKKQLARLTNPPETATFKAQPFSTPTPAFVATPTPAPTPTNKQLPKQRAKFPLGIVLAVVGVIVSFVVIAFYVWNGMNTSEQVDALFAQRKCAEVVKYDTFGGSFPKIIFSSWFGVYHQVEECQAHLALEQAVKSQDWPAAYSVAANYLAAYRGGVFAAEMNKQGGDSLLAWSKNLVAQNDYKTATDKLRIIQTNFSTSPAASTALRTMFDDYFLWARYSMEQKDYPSAEKYLKFVGSHEQAAPDQVQQANQGLAVVYLQWGKAQAESGKFNEGLQHYEDARKLSPDLTDYDRLKDQLRLLNATTLAKAADFDGALIMVKNVLDSPLSQTSKADAGGAQAKILYDYGHSDSPQAHAQMTNAAANMCKKQAPTTPIFAMDAETVRFAVVAPYNLSLPKEWTANKPAELHYVVCIDQSQTRIQTCPYMGGHYVYRNRYSWTITLYHLSTGALYKTTNLQGTNPRDCPPRAVFYEGAYVDNLYGNPPTIQQVTDWITGMNIVK